MFVCLVKIFMLFPVRCPGGFSYPVCVMVVFLLWFPALSRVYDWSGGHTMMLLIHGGDTHSRLHYLTQVMLIMGKYRVKTDQIGLKLESER